MTEGGVFHSGVRESTCKYAYSTWDTNKKFVVEETRLDQGPLQRTTQVTCIKASFELVTTPAT